jgi:hypothetical protein
MKESKIILGSLVLIAIAGGIYMYSKKQTSQQKTPPFIHPTPKTSTILNTQPITAIQDTQQILGTSVVTKNIPEDSQNKLLAESNTTVTQTNNNPTYVPPATSPITKPEEKPPIPIFVSPPAKPPIKNPPTNVSPPEISDPYNCIIFGESTTDTWSKPFINYDFANGKWYGMYFDFAGTGHLSPGFDNPHDAYNWVINNHVVYVYKVIVLTKHGNYYIKGFRC